MSNSPDRFIEDDRQDNEHLTTTALLIHLNTNKYHKTIEHMKDLQEMLSLQQQRLHNQQLFLVEQEKHLRRQEQSIYECSQHLTNGRFPNDHVLGDRQTDNLPLRNA